MKPQATAMLLPLVLILGGCIKYSYIPISLGLEPKEAHCKVLVFTRPPEQQERERVQSAAKKAGKAVRKGLEDAFENDPKTKARQAMLRELQAKRSQWSVHLDELDKTRGELELAYNRILYAWQQARRESGHDLMAPRLCFRCTKPILIEGYDNPRTCWECQITKKGEHEYDIDWGQPCLHCGRWFRLAGEQPIPAMDFCSAACAWWAPIDVDLYGEKLKAWPDVEYMPPLPQTRKDRLMAGVMAMQRAHIRWDPFDPANPGSAKGRLIGPRPPTAVLKILPEGVEVLSPKDQGGPKSAVLKVLSAAADTWLTADVIAERAHVRRADILRVLSELVAEGAVQRDGRGRRGAPYRFTRSPRCLAAEPPGTESGTETGTDSNAELQP